MDIGSITGFLFGTFKFLIILLLFIVIFGVVAFVLVWYRKKKKYVIPVREVISIGNGKINLASHLAGWIGTKSMFFGMYDYGNEQKCRTKDGREILEVSTVDMHDIDGKRGYIVKRKDDDRRLLVPLSRIEIKNEEILADIAPADFRDAALSITEEAMKENKGTWEKVAPFIYGTLAIVFAVIVILFLIQYGKWVITQMADLWREGIKNAASSVASSAAP